MLKNSNYPESFRESCVKCAQIWLKTYEAYWISPDMADDIIDSQKDLDDMCCGKYTKNEIYEEMQLHADTTVRMFTDLKSVDIKNAGDFGEFLSVLQSSKLYERFKNSIEARISSKGLPWCDMTVDRLISIAHNVLTILSANRDERIIHALQELILFTVEIFHYQIARRWKFSVNSVLNCGRYFLGFRKNASQACLNSTKVS